MYGSVSAARPRQGIIGASSPKAPLLAQFLDVTVATKRTVTLFPSFFNPAKRDPVPLHTVWVDLSSEILQMHRDTSGGVADSPPRTCLISSAFRVQTYLSIVLVSEAGAVNVRFLSLRPRMSPPLEQNYMIRIRAGPSLTQVYTWSAILFSSSQSTVVCFFLL